MGYDWIREDAPEWDAPKAEIIGGAPAGTFEKLDHAAGQRLPGEWWRVEEQGRVLGYGWLDLTWGDAETLLAVHPDARRRGVGSFILDRLEEEARRHGVNYLHNVVAASHPEREAVRRWLEGRGFVDEGDGRLRRRARFDRS